MKSIVRFIIRVILDTFFRVELVNKANIPSQGAALICANHIMDLDMFFMGYKLKRLIHYMAKEELFRIPLVAQFIRWVGAFPVKRGKGDVTAIKTALKLLDEGHIVGIFPQGTRTKGKDLSSIPVKRGAIMLAVNSGVPIIPVGIQATYKLFSKVRIVYGEPFTLDVPKDQKLSAEEMNTIAKMLMTKVYSLVQEDKQ